jgi:hypothetical protein
MLYIIEEKGKEKERRKTWITVCMWEYHVSVVTCHLPQSHIWSGDCTLVIGGVRGRAGRRPAGGGEAINVS